MTVNGRHETSFAQRDVSFFLAFQNVGSNCIRTLCYVILKSTLDWSPWLVCHHDLAIYEALMIIIMQL